MDEKKDVYDALFVDGWRSRWEEKARGGKGWNGGVLTY